MRSELTEPAEEEVFLPYLQNKDYLQGKSSAFGYLTLVVRTTGDPSAIAAAVKAQVVSLDKNVAVSEVQTMEEVVAQATAAPRFYLLLMGTFAFVALSLAAVGIYGVMSYSVSRRSHEIGVRMAIGAQQSDVMSLILRQGMTLVVIGLGVGVVTALACTNLMSGLLFGVKANDPLTFCMTVLVLLLIAVVANYIPARRATRVNPIIALRHE
jgi:putative ABC transport system permease protein